MDMDPDLAALCYVVGAVLMLIGVIGIFHMLQEWATPPYEDD